MATTPKGIYYPNDYNEIADIPEDMKKMAESIDEVFENTDSDLSDIKEEQTTQNNRLNSLEVDNTTNKSDILTNKQEINNIKTEQTTQNANIQTNADNISALTSRVTETEGDISDIKEEQTTQNTNISTNATNIESLQEENDNLKKIVSQLPQVTGQGTEVTLENTIEAPFTIFDVEGNSTQETTEGKNLANIHVITNVSNQFLSRQIVGDTIVLSNNTNASGYSTTEKKLSEICPNLKVDDIVKLSFKTTSTTAKPTNAIYLIGIDQLWYVNGVKTITQEMLDSIVILYGGYNETAVISEFMIRLSSITDDTYEKFTYGASPNPNYEQPVKSAGDNGSINEKITNSDGTEEQDYSIFVQQPFRSIGDVRDCFVKVNGNWYERHYIGEVVLDGNSTINNFYPNSGRCDISISNALLRGLCLCNYYQYKFAEENNKCFISGATSAFCFINTDIKSIEEVRAWLNEKQPEVIYQLATPLDLPCTEEQIQQLENKPSTYKDFTIIQSEDETPAYLEVSGIRDINTMFDKVTNAIVSLGGNV